MSQHTERRTTSTHIPQVQTLPPTSPDDITLFIPRCSCGWSGVYIEQIVAAARSSHDHARMIRRERRTRVQRGDLVESTAGGDDCGGPVRLAPAGGQHALMWCRSCESEHVLEQPLHHFWRVSECATEQPLSGDGSRPPSPASDADAET